MTGSGKPSGTRPSTRGLPVTATHRTSRRTRPSTRGLPPHWTPPQPLWTWTVSGSGRFTQAPRRTRPSTRGLPPHWMLSTSHSYLTHTQQSRTSRNPAQLLSSTAAPSGSPRFTFSAQSLSPLTLSGSRSSESISRTGTSKSVAVTTPGLICVYAQLTQFRHVTNLSISLSVPRLKLQCVTSVCVLCRLLN